MNKKIVVVGASAASIAFITKLRSFDKQSQVICFSGEKHIPYNRCFLADYVTGEKDFSEIRLKPEDFFAENNVDLRINSLVTSIHKDEKYVTFDGGKESYDYLFLGTGTRPFYPDIEGIDIPEVLGFHTFEDAEKIDEFIAMKKPKTAIVVGGGINGLEAASSLVDRGLQVAIVEMADQLMPHQVDSEVAHFIAKIVQSNKVMMLLNQSVEKIEETDTSISRVKLSSGAFLAVDCVVFATGCRVNSELVEQAGLELFENSLQVGPDMKTSDEFILAGGDICAAQDMVTQDLVRSATWPDAMLQGLCAATQLSEKPRNYPGVVGMRDSFFFDTAFYACGQTSGQDGYEEIQKGKKGSLRKFYLDGGCLKGFVLIGNIEKLAYYKQMYMTQCCIDESEL